MLNSKMKTSHGYTGVLKTSLCYIQRTKRSIKTRVILEVYMDAKKKL